MREQDQQRSCKPTHWAQRRNLSTWERAPWPQNLPKAQNAAVKQVASGIDWPPRLIYLKVCSPGDGIVWKALTGVEEVCYWGVDLRFQKPASFPVSSLTSFVLRDKVAGLLVQRHACPPTATLHTMMDSNPLKLEASLSSELPRSWGLAQQYKVTKTQPYLKFTV